MKELIQQVTELNQRVNELDAKQSTDAGASTIVESLPANTDEKKESN
ncbi:hypothetical protein L2672_04200 [Shewanella gaetbuli]|uniref:Uncharacterized protein n=1 Tax=Shewanella gaetbuli TaxID=220752 RepID=A0A9X1ZGG7_9GAMM|nr:hypothetical protein [Shewanella gaetbuli]MCL1141899.1 hypothetical protein [Shewanella gaetbuli]